jgi:hypothetical protein
MSEVPAGHCPMCNGPMDYPAVYQRLEVCIDCHDALSGKRRGTTKKRWEREDQAAMRRLMGKRRSTS